MNEARINTMIGNSLDWSHKISDGGTHGKLPFDIFGVYKGRPIYIETKYLPTPKSFNFHRLEDHQIKSLFDIQKLDEDEGTLISLFLVAVNFGRGDIRVFYFTDMHEINQRKQEKKNILKKEFESRTNYVTIKKGLIDFDRILEEITN